METKKMTVETLSATAAIVLSLIMSYVPGLSTKYQQLSGEYKRLAMVGLLLIVAVGTVVLACAGLGIDFGLDVTCDRIGIVAVLKAFIAALVANQAAYMVSPQKHAG
jgi:hypothetical protein